METIMEDITMMTGDTEVRTVRKQLGGPANRRLNSTGTMIVGDTVSCPNNDLTIQAVAERLYDYIRESTPGGVIRSPEKDDRGRKARSSKMSPNPHSENLPPHVEQVPDHPDLPTVEHVAQYLRKIFRTAQCSVDCTIVCLIYIERLMAVSKLQLTTRNWRSLIAIGMLLASKVNDDLSMVNADFACFLPFTVDQINAWERQFLAGIKYDVRVSAAHYTKYYFDLRERMRRREYAMHEVDGTMDTERAQTLEMLSFKRQRRLEEMAGSGNSNGKLRRAVSDQYCPSSANQNYEYGLPEAPSFAWHAVE